MVANLCKLMELLMLILRDPAIQYTNMTGILEEAFVVELD
jgi:hypothetical protein